VPSCSPGYITARKATCDRNVVSRCHQHDQLFPVSLTLVIFVLVLVVAILFVVVDKCAEVTMRLIICYGYI
jgi:hypothetical protein